MGITRSKIAYGIATGVASVGLFGAAALAAIGPATPAAATATVDPAASVVSHEDKRDGLKKILDGLVQKGVITQAQEDAILAAIKEAAPKHERAEALLKDLFGAASQYLGVSEKDLRAKLPGTSLAKIANETPGKSRDGLVAALTTAANADIAKALADGRITEDQAKKLRDGLDGRIHSLVDRTWPQRRDKDGDHGKKVGHPGAFLADIFDATARYLGMTRDQIMTALRGGKSLGELADTTPGKSRADLTAVLTASANTRIDQAVTDKKLTPEQAQSLKQRVAAEIAHFLDRKAPAKTTTRP